MKTESMEDNHYNASQEHKRVRTKWMPRSRSSLAHLSGGSVRSLSPSVSAVRADILKATAPGGAQQSMLPSSFHNWQPSNKILGASAEKEIPRKFVAPVLEDDINSKNKTKKNQTTNYAVYDDKHIADLIALWTNYQTAVRQHQQRVHEMDNKMNVIENSVDRFGKFCGEYQLIWKIRNFAACFEDAVHERRTSIPSPVFDTHRNGYKLQLHLCPNGDGKGKDQSMSLFFAILKGPYDSLLQWPFTSPVTMTLLAQVNDPAANQPHDVAMTFTPNPRPDNEPFLGRPQTERNLSLGFPKFISLKELFEGEYIKDDTMFIKVRVDLKNIIAL